MDWPTVITIISALGGLEFLKWFFNRKNNDRKAAAELRDQELTTHEKQIERYEERLSQRDLKVDAIYRELREEQAVKLSLLDDLNKAKLEIELLKHQKCEVRLCANRIPPGDY